MQLEPIPAIADDFDLSGFRRVDGWDIAHFDVYTRYKAVGGELVVRGVAASAHGEDIAIARDRRDGQVAEGGALAGGSYEGRSSGSGW